MEKRKLINLAVAVLVVTTTFGCSRQVCIPPPSSDATDQFPILSQSLKANIYLDGTLSMQGFIVPGTSSRYQQALPLLESTLERGWPGAQVAFYKFGTAITELPERTYLESQQPKFYLDNRINRETLIQNVIDQSSTDRLTLVVTDLFQSAVDVNLITNRIKEKYIKSNLAVGILAIKSEFSGQIFDVGPNNYAFNYHSDNSNPATFRPFYVLALGNHADVNNYFDQALRGWLGAFSEKHAVIFSRYISEKVASFEGSAITDISKLQEVPSLLPTDTKADHVKQFRIIGSATPSATFSAILDYKPLRYVMPLSSELESEVTAFTCGTPGANAGKEPQPLVENNETRRAFAIKEARLNESTLDFKAEITPAFLPGAGIYCFKTTLRPKEYKTPAWFAEWNMSSEHVEAWTKNPAQFNGATTFNLEAFLTNLWATTVQLHKPKIAEFYCYVKKD